MLTQNLVALLNVEGETIGSVIGTQLLPVGIIEDSVQASSRVAEYANSSGQPYGNVYVKSVNPPLTENIFGIEDEM